MKAIFCTRLGSPAELTLEEIEPPPRMPGGVRIAVHAAGLNFADLLMTRGAYQHAPEVPFIPGFEAAGVVEEVDGDEARLKVGDRVLALTYGGAFAEQIVVEAPRVMPVPDDMRWDVACKFGGAYCTAWIALNRRTSLEPGERLLVLGATSAVGLAAIDVGRTLGADIYAVARTEDAAAVLAERGAQPVIAATPEALRDLVFEATGDGVDAVFDPLGGAWFDAALRCCRWGGRLLVVGFAAGDIQQIPANLLLVKSLSSVGVFCNSHVEQEPDVVHRAMAELSTLWSDGKLAPLIRATFLADDIDAAMAALASREQPGGICLTF